MLKFFSLFLAFSTLSLVAEDAKTIKVKASEFIYKSELTGLILSSGIERVELDASQFQNWAMEEALPHGSAVKKGDVVARFNAEPFEEAVASSKRKLEIQKAELIKAQKMFDLNMRKMEGERKRSLLNAESARKQALIYKEKGHELAVKSFKQDLIDAQNSLLYQQEELNQLKKMYDEDKITEETEEIVLKRQKNYVESLTKRMKQRELAVEEALNIKLPSDLFNADFNMEKALLDEEKNKMEWEVFVLTEKLKLEGAELAFKKAEESYKELLKDKKFLEIKAESDGLVFYGSEVSGKWANQSGTEYKKGKVFLKGSYLFSIVDTSSFLFETKADYTQVQYINENSVYYSDIPGAGLRSLKLLSKSSVPDNGSFKVVLKIEDSNGVFHGTAVKAGHISKLGDKIISLPAAAVKRDKMNPVKQYVNAVKDGKTEKVYVETGLAHNGRVIITAGLQEGMEVQAK